MGVDAVEWPGDRQAAQALFDRMPDQLDGMPVKRPHFYGNSTGLQYGPANTGVTAWATGPSKEVKDPEANLAVMFGMQLSCKKDTFVGTATPLQKGLGPGFDPGRDGEFWWFSCTFKGGGRTTFTGHAIGWVSGDLAWLVTTPDKSTTQRTVAALTSRAQE